LRVVRRVPARRRRLLGADEISQPASKPLQQGQAMSQIIGKFSATSYAFQATAPAQNWIGGEWQDASTQETLDILNPRHGRAMSQVPMSGAQDVDRAVKAATAAQETWRQWPMRERAHVLYRL